VLGLHAEVVDTLQEWVEDVTGLGGRKACGSRVVVVSRAPGFGMDLVVERLFADLVDRFDGDGFWEPSLTGLAGRVGDPEGWPGFVWLGVTASPSGSSRIGLADQLSELSQVLGVRREGWRRVGFDTQSTVAGAVSLAAALIAGATGAGVVGGVAVGGVLTVLSQAVGVGSWAVDVVSRARFNRESVLANVAESQDVVVRGVRRLVEATSEAGLPVVIVADDAHVEDPLIDALITAVVTGPSQRVLLVVTGDRDGDQPGIGGDLGQRLRSPLLVAPLAPELIVNDPAPDVDRMVVVSELERLVPPIPPVEIPGLASEVADLAGLARWVERRTGDLDTDRALLGDLTRDQLNVGDLSAAGARIWQIATALGLVSQAVDELGWDPHGIDDLVTDGRLTRLADGVWHTHRTGPVRADPPVWAALPGALDRVDPASFEARQLARLSITGVDRHYLERSNQTSERVFTVAATAADLDDYHTAVTLGQGATKIRQGGRARQAWLAGIEQWRTQLATTTPEDSSFLD